MRRRQDAVNTAVEMARKRELRARPFWPPRNLRWLPSQLCSPRDTSLAAMIWPARAGMSETVPQDSELFPSEIDAYSRLPPNAYAVASQAALVAFPSGHRASHDPLTFPRGLLHRTCLPRRYPRSTPQALRQTFVRCCHGGLGSENVRGKRSKCGELRRPRDEPQCPGSASGSAAVASAVAKASAELINPERALTATIPSGPQSECSADPRHHALICRSLAGPGEPWPQGSNEQVLVQSNNSARARRMA
jgi:hypothetical protein